MAHVRRKLAKPKGHEDTILALLEREDKAKNPFACFFKESDWKQFKDEVLTEWIRLKPGTRPLAWWQFAAPEARRLQLSGAGEIRLRAMDHDNNYRYHKGLPEAYWFGDTLDAGDPLLFESQATYLARHDLFLPGEEFRLNDDAFEPERIKHE